MDRRRSAPEWGRPPSRTGSKRASDRDASVPDPREVSVALSSYNLSLRVFFMPRLRRIAGALIVPAFASILDVAPGKWGTALERLRPGRVIQAMYS